MGMFMVAGVGCPGRIQILGPGRTVGTIGYDALTLLGNMMLR
jgi:hypothetical protein